MTSWLENQKCILTKENTRRKRFLLRKNNEAGQNFCIWPNPIQSMDESNPCPTQWRNDGVAAASRDGGPHCHW